MSAVDESELSESLSGYEQEQCEPWLDDGDIIVRAGFKNFRVNQNLLAKHSTIFNDMFNCSSPEGDDCAEVTLPDDPEAVECLLQCLYDVS